MRTKISYGKSLLQGLFHLGLISWAIIQLFPLLFLFLSAFKTDAEIVHGIWSIPKHPTLENFISAWTGGSLEVPISRYFLNSVVVVGISLILTTFLGAMASYGLARFNFFGKETLRSLLIFALAIPMSAVIIPVYNLLKNTNLANNYLGLILVYAAYWLPFTILLLYSHFISFPKNLEEAAKIDGLSDWGIFLRIVVPVSRSPLISVSIVNFVTLWGELLFAFLIMNEKNMRTITVGVLAFKGLYEVQWGAMFAAMLIAVLPTLIFYIFFQERITKGMLLGSFR